MPADTGFNNTQRLCKSKSEFNKALSNGDLDSGDFSFKLTGITISMKL